MAQVEVILSLTNLVYNGNRGEAIWLIWIMSSYPALTHLLDLKRS